jgi:hypothetical protein
MTYWTPRRKVIWLILGAALGGGAAVAGVYETMSVYDEHGGAWMALLAGFVGAGLGVMMRLRPLEDRAERTEEDRRRRKRRMWITAVVSAVAAGVLSNMKLFVPQAGSVIDMVIYPALVAVGAMMLVLIGRRVVEWF